MSEFAVVDVETTGGSPLANKIIEIAVVVSDGHSIIDKYATLINPERNIPPYITSLTGINNEMVQDAPKFFEVAEKIFELTEGRIFVAHNVNFDYAFVRKEFADLGGKLDRKKLCTVRLSRRAFPGHKSYSLGNICQQLRIPISDRHRALGDAEATAILLHACLQKEGTELVEKGLLKSKEAKLPPNLPISEYEKLPTTTGVYYFHNRHGEVIYVGKAIDIRKRVLSHFDIGDQMHKRSFLEDIFSISYESCGSELVALLYESMEIKRLWPRFNRSQKRLSGNYALYSYTDHAGYDRLTLASMQKGMQPIYVFSSQSDGREAIRKLCNAYTLCPRLCGMQKTPGPCFDHQIGQCLGACAGMESHESYNERLRNALAEFTGQGKTFAIIGKGRSPDEQSVVLIENGAYLGFGFFPLEVAISAFSDFNHYIKRYPDNPDIQKILNMHVRKPGHDKILTFEAKVG